MDYKNQIERFIPSTVQEENDKSIIIQYIKKYNNVLSRENEIAHITSSGLILNKELTKVLMIHHNIYKTWAWTGGHADGERDLLKVAVKEAIEETGVKKATPLTKDIVSIDILPVYGHFKNNKYVSAHLHLSVAYILIVDENEKLLIKEDENSDIKWINIKDIGEYSNEPYLIKIYEKIIGKARTHNQ